MFKAIIFDLDGVLCNTDTFHYLAWKEIFASEHIAFSEEDNNLLRGVSRRESLERILALNNIEMTEKHKQTLLVRKNDIYRGYLAKMNPFDVDKSVLDALNGLKERFKLAVGSSSKNTKLILSKLALSGYFDAIADGTMITYSKPNPEVFLLAASMLNLKSRECLVVEDAQSGIDAAINGGFITVGIGPASSYNKADIKIKSLSQLLSIL